MKHRALALLLSAGLLLALPACGGNDSGTGAPTDSPVLTDTPAPESTPPAESDLPETELPEETAPAPTETPEETPDVSESPSQSPSPSQKPSPSPSPTPSPSPSPMPSPTPTPTPPQETTSSDSVDLKAFYDSLVANDADFAASMEITGDFLTNYYPGLADVSTEQRVIYTPMISALVCEIALVEVTDSADVDTVKAIFQARIDSQVGTDDAPGGAWYPASIETWKTHSQIVSHGNYVMLIAYDKDADVVSAFNALFA